MPSIMSYSYSGLSVSLVCVAPCTVLAWFRSCLSGRTFRVIFSSSTSSIVYIVYSVPQGSLYSGLLLFVVYTGLHQLRCSRRSLDAESAATLVHAFVASSIDCCNAVLACAPKATTDKLQLDSVSIAEPLQNRQHAQNP